MQYVKYMLYAIFMQFAVFYIFAIFSSWLLDIFIFNGYVWQVDFWFMFARLRLLY